jgi:hypothetical protein
MTSDNNSNDDDWISKIKSDVKKAVEDTNNDWDEESWTDFVEEEVLPLLRQQDRRDTQIVQAAVGLIKYGIRNKADLIDVADTKESFRNTLKLYGMLPAICDKLYKKYVAPEQPQQLPTHTDLFDRLMPMIKVVLEEVRQSRRSRLNCWERESARTTGSNRDPHFRQKVISYYKRKTNSKKKVRCQVLDELTSVGKAQDTIIAAHIWKASTRGRLLDEFGLLAEDVNNERNGMFLTKGIEDAFDKQQVCFLYHVFESTLVLWVADTSIMSKTIEGSMKTFADVHQKPLLCPPGHMPYRRLLSWHARLTLELRRQTLQVAAQHYTSQYDTSPGRGDAGIDPIARLIGEMVRHGDDASASDE